MGVFFFDDLRQNPVSLRQRIFSFLAPNSPRTSAQDPLLNRKGSAPKVPMADVVKDSLFLSTSGMNCNVALNYFGVLQKRGRTDMDFEGWASRLGFSPVSS